MWPLTFIYHDLCNWNHSFTELSSHLKAVMCVKYFENRHLSGTCVTFDLPPWPYSRLEFCICDLWPPTLTLEPAWILYMWPLTSHLDLGVGINPVYVNFDLILILEQTTYFDLGGGHESCTYDLWKHIFTLEQTWFLCMWPLTAYLDLGVGMNPVHVIIDIPPWPWSRAWILYIWS